ncbi:MAG: hypothetical protein JKX85_07755 [Phycisphaeraceae bacterium]|nr:hypothetical protein [Phycisphaeraceae bacterium]
MRVACLLVMYVGLFSLTLMVSTWGNDFPVAYHPDEPSKVLQLTGRLERNHRHPPLLLDLSQWVHKILGRDNTIPSIAASGRLTSALGAACVAVLFTAMSHRLAGGLAAVLVGIMVGLCPSLTLFAHYMKEDVLLVLGVTAVWASSVTFWLKPTCKMAACLGFACVLAVMAKYLGAVALLVGVVLVFIRLRRLESAQRWKMSLSFFIAMVLSLLVLGYHWWSNGTNALNGLKYELDHVKTGHQGLEVSFLSNLIFYGKQLFWQLQYWPTALGVMGLVWLTCSAGKKVRLAAKIAMGLFLVYALCLLLGRVSEDRYALPLVVLLSWFAAMCIEQFIRRIRQARLRCVISIVTCFLVLGAYSYMSSQVAYQFTHDGRLEMGAWVQANLNASNTVVEDMYCAMPDQRYDIQTKLYGKWVPKIRMKHYAADFGTIDQLLAKGVTHIAVCNYSYGRFLEGSRLFLIEDADQKMKNLDQHRREFYCDLLKSGHRVWQHQPRYVLPGLTSPDLAIYRLQ